ncbi:hypothetical protein [Micromonospora sp. NPDC005205]|uniref:hypothetical protein n=1 Tax=Micromonospora sp. NPDC005205 TaxID=3156714 RepID=UPI0033A0CBE1
MARAFDATAAAAAAFADDHELLAQSARNVFETLREQGRVVSPIVLLPALASKFGAIRGAADMVSGETRSQLLSIAARYAEYAGWMIQEAGDAPGALVLTERAANLARAAGDHTMAEYALLRRADIALYGHDARIVVAWAIRAESGVSPEVRLLAAQRAAQGWAVLGQRSRCLSALARAADETAAVEESTVDLGSSLGSRGGGRLMQIVRGWCYLDLGIPRKAVDALEIGMSLVPTDARRARALYGVRLALSHAVCGNVHHAYDAGMTALDEAAHVDSASVRHQLRLLAAAARGWPHDARLDQFRRRIDGELAAARRLS